MAEDILLCPPAQLSLDPSGIARADDFGDVYFSAEDGLAEARAVFLTGAGLPERWMGRRRFTVAELGMGTGLNLLALMALWRTHRPAKAWLDIVSVEARPLHIDQARAALRHWTELHELAEMLLAVWPPRYKGVHRRRIDALGVTLTILHEDAATALADADFRADTWFLDGFAPAKNPSMWSEALFTQIARLSAPGARVATFTVAGVVKRGLRQVGFETHKRTGFGKKRERLEAVFHGPAPTSIRPTLARLPPIEGPVTVIGGGIAAAALAHALRARGRACTLIARGGLAQGASGAPAGLLTPRLEAADRPHVRATLAAFAYSRTLYSGCSGFYPEGVMRLAPDAPEGPKSQRLLRIATMLQETLKPVDGPQARDLTGIAELNEGVYIPNAAHFTPSSLVAALAQGTTIIDAQAERWSRSDDGLWRVFDPQGRVLTETPILILAGGAELGASVQALVPLRPRAGWVQVYKHTEKLRLMRALAWGHYLIPMKDAVLLGATHRPSAEAGPLGPAAEDMRRALDDRLPHCASMLTEAIGAWSGVRATTPDHLPVVGPLDDGLAICTGFGARGFAHAPLFAEMLVGDLEGSPTALSQKAIEAFHPRRFSLRAQRRAGNQAGASSS